MWRFDHKVLRVSNGTKAPGFGTVVLALGTVGRKWSADAHIRLPGWFLANFKIVGAVCGAYSCAMPKAAGATKRIKSDDQLLDQGISQLLVAVKQHAAAKGKPVKRDQLLEEGYSERFIAKVEEV